MKFSRNYPESKSIIILSFFLFLLSSCTATKPWHSSDHENWQNQTPQEAATVEHRMFLIGDTGEPVLDGEDPVLVFLEKKLLQAGENSSIVFLGDNIYRHGFEPEPEAARALAEAKLTKTLSALHNFKGSAFFVPGNHDWWSNFEGLKLQDDFISNYDNVDNL
ncbi:MAG: metallophosphoesterase, partial [Balneolaceae bacterium]